MKFSFLLLVARGASATYLRSSNTSVVDATGGANASGLPALAVVFELGNVNYNDLEKKVPAPVPYADALNGELATTAPASPKKGSNVESGFGKLSSHFAKAHKDWSKANRDTVHKISKHVSDTFYGSSKGTSEAVATSAKVSHDVVGGATKVAHKVTSGTATTIHEGVHGEDEDVDHGETSFVELADRVHQELLVADLVRKAIRDAFQDAISSAVAKTQNSASDGNSSAPAPVAAAALNTSNASNASNKSHEPPTITISANGSAAEEKVNIFVQFNPGSEKPIAIKGKMLRSSHYSKYGVDASKYPPPPIEERPPKAGEAIMRHANPYEPHKRTGQSTVVHVVFTGVPDTGTDELVKLTSLVETVKADGSLDAALDEKLGEVIGLRPSIQSFAIRNESLVQWKVADCEKHMETVIRQFSVAYTRRMVPTAIFNECTNFLSAMSFSHDRVASNLDVQKCREATVNFAKIWNYGVGGNSVSAPPGLRTSLLSTVAVPTRPPVSMKAFCVDVCEFKYGPYAPECHVTEGRALLLKKP